VVAKPRGEVRFIDLATGQGKDEVNNLLLWGINSKAVQPKKEVHGLKSDTLVSVHKWMVLGDAKSIRGG